MSSVDNGVGRGGDEMSPDADPGEEKDASRPTDDPSPLVRASALAAAVIPAVGHTAPNPTGTASSMTPVHVTCIRS